MPRIHRRIGPQGSIVLYAVLPCIYGVCNVLTIQHELWCGDETALPLTKGIEFKFCIWKKIYCEHHPYGPYNPDVPDLVGAPIRTPNTRTKKMS